MLASLVSVNLAVVRPNSAHRHVPGGSNLSVNTGIDKRAADGPVRLDTLGVAGDSVCDTRHHGGVDQAVYSYAIEDLRWWADELAGEIGFAMQPGCLGENLTTAGIDISAAVIGERWQIGETLLQVSAPRIPCSTFAAFWKVDKLVKRFTAAARPGAYLRVLTPGLVQAGDGLQVVHRPAHGLTISETFRAMSGDRSLASKVLSAPELPASVHRSAQKWASLA